MKTAPEPVTATKGELRRAEILAVARKLLVREGYDCFVMREVAARIGATLGNLQYYFASRDDLLEAVVRAEFEQNQHELAELAASGRSPHKKLTAITKHLIEVWAHEGGRVYVVMSLLALHQRRFRALHVEIYSSFYEALMPVLRELKPRAGRAELLGRARLISTLIDGALVQVPDRNFLAQAVAAVLRIAEE